MVHQVFQLEWSDRSLLIDTAFPREALEQMGGGDYDDAAFARVVTAMGKAEAVVVTHEHADHLGGASRMAPDAAARLRLTPAQLAAARALEEAGLSARRRRAARVWPAPAPGVAASRARPHAWHAARLRAQGSSSSCSWATWLGT
jgi:glyoxylase-like metal-dependent hydrolase (beta-lactamase superfamily II)